MSKENSNLKLSKQTIPPETIEQRILLIRGHKAMLDRDLAVLYGVKAAGQTEQG